MKMKKMMVIDYNILSLRADERSLKPVNMIVGFPPTSLKAFLFLFFHYVVNHHHTTTPPNMMPLR